MSAPRPAESRANSPAWPVVLGVVLSAATLAYLRFVPEMPSNVLREAVAYDFRQVKWFALGVAAVGWACLLLFGRLRTRPDPGWGMGDALLLLLVIWAAFSLFWTPDVKAAASETSHVVLLLVVFLLARFTDRTDLCIGLSTFACFSVLGAVLLSTSPDSQSVHNGFGNENFASEFILLVSCLALLGYDSFSRNLWRIVALSASGAGFAWLLFSSGANLQFIGIAAVVSFVLVVTVVPPRFRLHILWLSALVVCGGVAIFLAKGEIEALPQSFLDRLQIWANTLLMIGDAPLLGRGLGGFYHDYAGYTDAYQETFPGLGEAAYSNYDRVAPAAENEILHVLAAFGIVGLFLAVSSLVAAFVDGVSRVGRAEVIAWGAVVAVLGMSLVSFPLQNPATSFGVVAALGVLAPLGWRISANTLPLGKRTGAAAAIVLLALPLYVFAQELRAQIRFSAADAHYAAGDLPGAADLILEGNDISDLSPRTRLRLFTQVIVGGPAYWQSRRLTDELEGLYVLSASAAPSAPLLLDLRARYLLSRPLDDEAALEVERIIAELTRLIGNRNPSPHILEAALAVQSSNLERAERALDRARPLLANLNPEGDPNGFFQNFQALEGAVRRARGMR